MNTASSNPPPIRASAGEPARGALDILERLARGSAPLSSRSARHGSGTYRMDEYAGLDRLDRAELDEE